MSEPKAVRLSRLADEISYALGEGEFPELKLREFRFLWQTTPNQEKDNLSLTLRDIEQLVKDLRREQLLSGGVASQVQRIPIEHLSPHLHDGLVASATSHHPRTMGIASKFLSLFSRQPAQAATVMQKLGRTEVVEVERFAAAQTHRLNRAHWANAHGQSINNDLATQLATLQARCAYEYSSNPMFEGVCNTFRDDVVGRDGPMLQVISDNEQFNTAVEGAVRQVFADPDPSHRYGGVEVIKTWVNGLLLAGSYLNITANVRRDRTPITFGWRSLHSRRLVTPPEHVGDPNVAFGCRRDQEGAPIEYYVDTTQRQGPYDHRGLEWTAYQASLVQHVFMPVEAEQLTGYPMMSSTLETAADLQDYDKYVMEAAKNAAAHAVGLQATHPELVHDVKPIDSATYQISPGQANVAPAGYAWSALQATQPAAQYVDFRQERVAELGRPIHMPLLVVLLTAAEANFSSAQYEGAVYADGCRNVQGLIERRSLDPYVHQIVTEVVLRGMAQLPEHYELVWTWNVPAHANIEKFVRALETMVKNGLIAPSHASALLGYDWEKVVAARAKCQQDLVAAGLPTPNGDKSGSNPANENDEDDADDEKPKKPRIPDGLVALATGSPTKGFRMPDLALPKDPVRDLMLDRGLTVRESAVGSVTEEERSFEAVVATEQRVQVVDWSRYEIIDEILLARGGQFPDYCVLLDNHQRHSGVNSVMGSAGSFRQSDDHWLGTGTVGVAVEGNIHREQLWQDIRDKHLRTVSIGYRVLDAVEIAPGRKGTIDGRTFQAGERTLRITTSWAVHELSLTPIGADSMALIRSHHQPPTTNPPPRPRRNYFR